MSRKRHLLPANKVFIFFVAFLLFAFPEIAISGHLHQEKVYQQHWCGENNGILEFRLDDGTRVDCLTDEYAIEFDFASKWAESIGQSLYYAERTGKKPGVVLIMEREKDERYFERLDLLARKHGIKVWRMLPL